MAFDGSGTFVRVHNWQTDKANDVKIVASRHDTEDDGFATGLSNTICRDGQSTIIADIPFNNKNITGLGDATAATDAMNRQAGDARYLRASDAKANDDWDAITESGFYRNTVTTATGVPTAAAWTMVHTNISADAATQTAVRRTDNAMYYRRKDTTWASWVKVRDEEYEAGSWTPTFTFATAGDLSVTYSTRMGRYRRYGDMVWIGCVLEFTPTHTTASGSARVTGLPFTSLIDSGGAYAFAFDKISNVNLGSSVMMTAGTQNGSQTAIFRLIRDSAAAILATTSQFPSGTTFSLTFSGVYPI